jgi:hypothetical protein
MTEQMISDITLEYMMNKDQYAKYIGKNNINKKDSNRKDKKFYRKRIIDLTKKLLNNEKPETMYPDVTSAFEYYTKICVEYFKVLDKTDILQEDYIDISANSLNEIKNDFVSETSIDADNLMMRSIKIQEPNALEKLVKRKSTKMKKQTILPLQKNINLKDPNLKNKGICKKNNIDNKYEQITQNTYEKNDEKIPAS